MWSEWQLLPQIGALSRDLALLGRPSVPPVPTASPEQLSSTVPRYGLRSSWQEMISPEFPSVSQGPSLPS